MAKRSKPSSKRNLDTTRRKGRPADATAQATGAGPGTDLLDLDGACRLLKTTQATFYRWMRAGRVRGMKVGRQWRFDRAEIERFLKGEQPRIELPVSIEPLIGQLTAKLKECKGKQVSLGDPDQAGHPVTRAVGLMMSLGTGLHVSDMHIDPQGGEAQIRCRIDGVLHPVARFDVRLLPAVVAEWKRLGACDVNEKSVPQYCVIVADADGSQLDMRVCIVPASQGEAITVRFLHRAEIQFRLDGLGYSKHDLERIVRAVHSASGLIIVTGPTGAGKTTTLYSILTSLLTLPIKVMTIEDPVEYVIPGAVQMPLNPKASFTFPRAILAMLRSAPNVMMVGEIRDRETAELCCQAGLTGHLVLTTLHTDDAAGALTRLVNLGLDPFLVSDKTRLVLAQRLVRCLCPHCAVERTPASSMVEAAVQLAQKGGLTWNPMSAKFKAAVGCDKCARTGFRGRMPIAEALVASPEISAALRRQASATELRAIAVGQGMTTMAADGVRRAANGETTLDEVFAVAPRE